MSGEPPEKLIKIEENLKRPAEDQKNENPNKKLKTDFSFSIESRPIRKKFLIELTKQIKKIVKSEQNSCKILKFSSEWNLEEILHQISKLQIDKFKNLFIFIFEVDSFGLDENNKEGYNVNFQKIESALRKLSIIRPLILQITSKTEDNNRFYYNEENSEKLIKIDQNYQNQKDYNFPSFFCNFTQNNINNYLDKYPVEDILKMKDSILIIKFLKVFELSEDFLEDLIFGFAAKANKQQFLTALDCYYIDQSLLFNSEVQEIKILSTQFKDNKSYTSILLVAVKNMNEEVINCLIEHFTFLIQQIKFDHKVEISTRALLTKQINVLCDLLEFSVFPFPRNFKIDSINNDRLCQIANTRNNFHSRLMEQNVESGTDEISHLIDENLNLKTACDSNNHSIMFKALNKKKYDLYFYLKSIGFYAHEFKDYSEKIKHKGELNRVKRIAWKWEKRNFDKSLQYNSGPVLLLCLRSLIHNKKISSDQEKEYRRKIKEWYTCIYNTEFGPELLGVAAQCENLRILFDFECVSVSFFCRYVISLLIDF